MAFECCRYAVYYARRILSLYMLVMAPELAMKFKVF